MRQYVQYLDNSDLQAILLLVVAVMITAWALYVIVNTIVATARRRRERKKRLVEEALNRLKRLPRFDTSQFIQVPRSQENKFYGTNRSARRRRFAISGRSLLVFDEEGVPWLGCVTKRAVWDLRRCWYISGDYFVPVKGWDQEECAPTVLVGKRFISVYPIWFEPCNTERTPEEQWEWECWKMCLEISLWDSRDCYFPTLIAVKLSDELLTKRACLRAEFDMRYAWYYKRYMCNQSRIPVPRTSVPRIPPRVPSYKG